MLDQTAHNPVPTVYAAIELSKKSWVVAIMQPAKDQPSVYRIKGGAFSDLVMRLRTATLFHLYFTLRAPKELTKPE